MKRIICEAEITPGQAMKWYCWHQIVFAMEKEEEAISKVLAIMQEPQNRNIPNWEEKFLLTFLENAKNDLILP